MMIFLKGLSVFLLVASMFYLFTNEDKLAIYIGFAILIFLRIIIG